MSKKDFFPLGKKAKTIALWLKFCYFWMSMEPAQILIEWLKNRRYKILIILGLILFVSKIIDDGHFVGILAMYVSVAIGLTFYYIIAKLESILEPKNAKKETEMLETHTSTPKTLIGIDTALYNEFLEFLAGENPVEKIESLMKDYMEGVEEMENTGSFSKMTRTLAKALCEKKGIHVSSCYTFASRNKRSDCHWADVNPAFLENPWTIILNDQYNSVLRVLQVPANTFTVDQFYIKDGTFLNLTIDPSTLVETLKNINFSRYKVEEVPY